MSIEKDIALLRGVATFDMLSAEALRIIAISAEERHLAAEEVLFRRGETADCAYVVVSGRVDLVDDRKSDAPRVLHVAGPGALLGETALIVATPRPTSAVASEPTVVMRIARSTFVRMLESFPDATAKLRRSIAKRLEDTIRALDNVRAKLEDQRQHRRR
ncbi:cyclic nucleotide-binding domain-containing protein [Xanthobacter sp. AM11]|uniref:cyclic nucleotide-binding domain-containing protein n=1 Tax=Xanthobacter sp. AM11 TaxID=3380643 RepID=UPI0039BF5CB8